MTQRFLTALVIVGFLLGSVAAVWPSISHAAPVQFSDSNTKSVNTTASVSDDGVDWDDVIAVQYGHSDPSHTINNPEVQERIRQAISTWQVAVTTPGGPDPKKIICKVTEMVKGATYVAIWVASVEDPLVGSVSVYDKATGQWVTSYEGKVGEMFRVGIPRGAKTSTVDDSCGGINPPPLPG